MKKVVFSAIAMIAFVGSSMGNTVEVKEEKIELGESCESKAMDFLNYIDPDNELDAVTAHNYYRSHLEGCYAMTNTKPKQIIEHQ